jgi:hypothetical protein
MPRFHWAVRCTARAKRTGRPCRAWAVRGALVCRAHGGAASQVLTSAAKRLEAAKAERRLVRQLGRELTPLELARLHEDWPRYRRLVREQLAWRRADAAYALARLRNELKAEADQAKQGA